MVQCTLYRRFSCSNLQIIPISVRIILILVGMIPKLVEMIPTLVEIIPTPQEDLLHFVPCVGIFFTNATVCQNSAKILNKALNM